MKLVRFHRFYHGVGICRIRVVAVLFSLLVLGFAAGALPLASQGREDLGPGVTGEPGLAATFNAPASGLGKGSPAVAARLKVERKDLDKGTVVVPKARRIKRASGERSHRQGSRGERAPWVAVRTLTPPGLEEEELFRKTRAVEKLPPWYTHSNIYDTGYEVPSDYLVSSDEQLLESSLPPEAPFVRAVKRLAERKFYLEVRRFLKEEWRKSYDNSSGLTYDQFEERLLLINEIGREPGEYGLQAGDYYSSELKGELFEKTYVGGERDIPILAWGPLRIMDSGAMKVHFEELLAIEGFFPQVGEPEKKSPGSEGILLFDEYRIDTNFRLGFDMGAFFEGDDLTRVINSYGISVSVDWLSKVLGRELMTTEFEAEFDRDGGYGFAFNWILSVR
ncbi:MAG: hypothetical protein VYD81_08340 [Planctomycetota bacterium]|nr:hypothetical protein [Planctomycetota bacterium]